MPWKFWVPFSYWHKMREQAWEIKSGFSQDSPLWRWGCQCQQGQGDGCEVLSGRGGQGFRITIQSLSIVLSDPAKDVWILPDFWWTSLGWNGDFLPGRATVVRPFDLRRGQLWPVRGQLTLSTLAISYALLVIALLLSHSWVPSTWKPTRLQRLDQNTSAFGSPSDFCCWKPKDREVLFQIQGLPFFICLKFLLSWYEYSISWKAS